LEERDQAFAFGTADVRRSALRAGVRAGRIRYFILGLHQQKSLFANARFSGARGNALRCGDTDRLLAILRRKFEKINRMLLLLLQ
jgi:hypothetical protein